MLNEASLQAVERSRWGDQSVKPLYHSYCFAQLPRLVTSLFGEDGQDLKECLLGPLAGTYETVILLLIDGFGWQFFERYHQRYPFLARFLREGVVTKLTAQFPSTTAVHITTIHSGLPVGQSGVYEWFQYEPSLDAMVAPLTFCFAEDTERNTLRRAAVAPTQIFPPTELYPALARQGVTSYVIQNRDFTPGPSTETLCTGARLLPCTGLRDALEILVEVAGRGTSPSYYYLYFGGIDTAGHRSGPGSAQFDSEVDACFTLLEAILHPALAGNRGNTLLLLTADHGQVEVDPARTVYLDTLLPEILRWTATNGAGRWLLPAGFQRDLFLHIRPEHVEEARDRLPRALEGRADVHLVADLIDQGFFGATPLSPRFMSRVGNLVILPHDGETVWWSSAVYPRQFRYYGQHGGLSRAEMETPLLALSYR